MKNILSYDDYQKKLSELTTPEEVAQFAQDLIAPMLKNLQGDTGEEKDDETPFIPLPKKSKYNSRNPYDLEPVSPWYDVVANDTESRIIDLYAKGLTTRDIVNYLKRNHGIEMSQSSISGITDKVYPLVKEWQSRPLSSCYQLCILMVCTLRYVIQGKLRLR